MYCGRIYTKYEFGINSKTAEKAQLRLIAHYTPIKINRLGALENIKIRVFGLFRQSQYDT